MFDRSDARRTSPIGTSQSRLESPANEASGPGRQVSTELRAYLRELSRTALLTAEDDSSLGGTINSDASPASQERMVRTSLHLVVAIARNFSGRGLPFADLVAEGNIGLVRAAEDFDPAQGARFSTYASWWIKQAIKQALPNAARPVDRSRRLPLWRSRPSSKSMS